MSRIDKIKALALEEGFESLEDVMIQYLSVNMADSPRLKEAQRKARRRFLADLNGFLGRSTETWSKWEVDGYEQGVLRAAEIVLARETRKASQSSFHVSELQPVAAHLYALVQEPRILDTCDALRDSVSFTKSC